MRRHDAVRQVAVRRRQPVDAVGEPPLQAAGVEEGTDKLTEVL